MNRQNIIFLVLTFVMLQGCAGMSPNAGQRTVEHNFNIGNFEKAVNVLYENVDYGEPWAQVRLAGLYYVGDYLKKDYERALILYLKAAIQVSDTRWAKGEEFFSSGRNGWFAQNIYAYTAQAYLGEMLYSGKGVPPNRVDAYMWLNNAHRGMFIDTGGVYKIPYEMESILATLEGSLSKDERDQVKLKSSNWEPKTSDLYKEYETRLH